MTSIPQSEPPSSPLISEKIARQTSFLDTVWIPVKDGNDTGRAIFDQHYSRYRYADGRKPLLYVGPGEKAVLISPDALALFVWRKFRSMDHQDGVNCAVFRNEGPNRSSDLIRAAQEIAWQRWPHERLYTYVDPTKIRRKRDPGRCFLRAGWKYSGWTKGGLRILDILPPEIDRIRRLQVEYRDNFLRDGHPLQMLGISDCVLEEILIGEGL